MRGIVFLHGILLFLHACTHLNITALTEKNTVRRNLSKFKQDKAKVQEPPRRPTAHKGVLAEVMANAKPRAQNNHGVRNKHVVAKVKRVLVN